MFRVLGASMWSHLAAWALLPALCLVVAVGLHLATPIQVIEDDLRFGKLPLVEDLHQALDTLAILPQFSLFCATARHKRVVPPCIVFWIMGLAASRFLAFVSGMASVVIEYSFLGSMAASTQTQLFFTLGQLFNLIILSDFVYYYLKSRTKKKDPMELSYDELPL